MAGAAEMTTSRMRPMALGVAAHATEERKVVVDNAQVRERLLENGQLIPCQTIRSLVERNDLNDFKRLMLHDQGNVAVVAVNALFKLYSLCDVDVDPVVLDKFIECVNSRLNEIVYNKVNNSDLHMVEQVRLEVNRELYHTSPPMVALANRVNYASLGYIRRFQFLLANSYGDCGKTSKATTASIAGFTGLGTSVVALIASDPGGSSHNASLAGIVFSVALGIFPVGYLAAKACTRKL